MGATPLRLVVFDVDGTLVDSQAHIMSAMESAFAATGRTTPPRAEVLGIVGLSLPQAMARLVPGIAADDLSTLVDAYKDGFAGLRAAGGAGLSPFFPGARAVLDGMLARTDLLVGLATGKSRRGLDHVLAAHGLTGAFVTEQVADNHPSKPNPSMLHAALAETGVEPRHAVIVGDTSFDMEMGRAAGVGTIGVSWGYHPVTALAAAGAQEIVEGWDQLGAALDRVWEG